MPIGVQRRPSAGRYHTGRVVLLNDAWPLVGRGERCPVQHRCGEPAKLGSEIGLARGKTARRRRVWWQELVWYARVVGNPLPNHLNGHYLHRLIRSGTMTIGPFVLLAKRLCERGKSWRVQCAARDWDGQFKGLPLVVQV